MQLYSAVRDVDLAAVESVPASDHVIRSATHVATALEYGQLATYSHARRLLDLLSSPSIRVGTHSTHLLITHRSTIASAM